MTFGRKLLAPVSATVIASLVSLVSLGACGGDDDGPGPGETVWSAEVRTLVLASSGGGFLPTPPNSECEVGSFEYELDVATSQLSAVTCSGNPLRKVARQRALTAAEMTELEPALQELKVVDEMTCGADKPELTLTVTTAAGTREYRDSFYSCLDDPRPTIASSALDALVGRFTALAAP